MSYDLTNDGEPVPGPSFPGISAEHLRRLYRWGLILAALVLLVLALWWAINVYTNWLWFSQLGLLGVYTKILSLRVGLYLGGALVAALVLAFNLYLALSLSRGPSVLDLSADSLRLLGGLVVTAAALSVLVAAPLLGGAASGNWEALLLYFNRVPFGVADPQFGLEVSFYVVTLELLNLVRAWLLALAITAIATALALYVAVFTVRGVNLVITPRMLKHLAGMGIALMLLLAAGHVLSVYELVLSAGGVVAGATYTDVHARLPIFWFLAGIALLAAAGFGVSAYFAGLRLMVGSFTLWVLLVLLGGLAYPAVFQRLQVAPDEFAREEIFIARNIQATRAAYALDGVSETDYPARGKLTPQTVQENRSTIDNIRLWDPGPLRDAYNQLQFMELYYSFRNMDSDRYVVDGRLRQVLTATREIDAENLPADAQNWVNQRLAYTHGYGMAMSPTNGFTPGEGRPEYLLRDIPIRGEFPVTRPEIYYGENPISFAVVNSAMTEVDPRPDFQRYDGTGGITLSSAFRRFAYAVRFGDINLLLSDQVTPDSRIQLRRHVRQRVAAIAPFLELDPDPYPVLDDQGKVWWIQDAFTTTDRYPYSTPSAAGFNYIRNSVKVVVDAYNGDVSFYLMDPQDPLIRMYQRAFPELFQDISAMPADLRSHIRYPITLFSAQAQTYLRYHVTDSQVFFNQSEQWSVPLETRIGKTGVRVRPSYLVMKLPGQETEEFVLLLPFSPAGQKKNLVGWLAARNDWPNYGQLVSFLLPDDRQIDGPSQVEARIENDQLVSQQFTLWDGSGSEIIRGQLLVIPIADTILYAEPLYLQSEALAFPELKKVILADASNLVMADTIDEALALLVGTLATSLDSPGDSPGDPSGAASLGDGLNTQQLLTELDRIEDSVEGLGTDLENLEEALENIRNILGGGSP